jgi:phospholipid-transporting ATPase
VFLTPNQFLLRGSSLQNTDWVVGIAMYTGHETKIMQNSVSAKAKFSDLETQMNKQIFLLFLFQIFCCIIAAIVYETWRVDNKDDTKWYLALTDQQGGDYL